MALRTSKISSEIIQRCNKYFSNNAEASLKSRLLTTSSTDNNSIKPQRPFRYKIANTEKPQGLPQLNFHDDETPLFAELQPCADPEFRFDQAPQKWADTQSDNSPFPKFFKQQSYIHMTYSDKQKAEDKFIKCKMASFTPPTRNFSTAYSSTHHRHYSRNPSDNNSKGDCKGKIDKCVKIKKKECKVGQNKNCPQFGIRDCKQSKGSNCALRYLNPNCVKKFAPYPSYSEACAEDLPVDPSECQQCPWRTCDDADTIEPGKPVRSKRHYSTCCNRYLETSGVVVGSPVPHPSRVREYTCNKKCGVTKSPCKEPPGPCEVRKRKEEHKRGEERKWRRYDEPKKKKASDVEERMVLNGIQGTDEDIMINPYTLEPIRITLDDPKLPSTTSWIDIIDGPEAFLDKQEKPPFCKNKKKPKRPKANTIDIKDPDKAEIIEYGDVDWWSGRGKRSVVTEPLDPKACPNEKCRKQHIRSKAELFLVQPEMLLSKKGSKKIKGDEGHPPPCPDNKKKSKRCPKEPLKKPKYKKKTTNVPFYKRPEDPYTPNE